MRSERNSVQRAFTSLLIIMVVLTFMLSVTVLIKPESFFAIFFDKVMAYVFSPVFIGGSLLFLQELWKFKDKK